MPYLLASILAIVSAMVLMLTRYEADDSVIKSEIEQMKVMFSMIDGYVNTYLETGNSISTINFETLQSDGILLDTSTVTGVGLASRLTLPHDEVVWQLIPNIGNSSSYKLLVDIRANIGLQSKARFSESFIGREYCEKTLFGTFETLSNEFDVGTSDFVSNAGTNADGLFVCVVFK